MGGNSALAKPELVETSVEGNQGKRDSEAFATAREGRTGSRVGDIVEAHFESNASPIEREEVSPQMRGLFQHGHGTPRSRQRARNGQARQSTPEYDDVIGAAAWPSCAQVRSHVRRSSKRPCHSRIGEVGMRTMHEPFLPGKAPSRVPRVVVPDQSA